MHEIAELTEHTEGWSAGLYLAALSAKASGAGIKGVTAFRGDDRFLADYLRSELLSRLPPDELRFLTRTSVLERMSGPLCDAVLDSSGSAAELESLERSNLFMVPLDRTGEWYRYHHLFQELLRAELGRVEPDLLPRLLARAADWCEANGQPETAIGYAQAADDVNRTARLIVRNYLDTYNSGRAATVERWLGWLDAHGAIETNAAVAVIGGLTAALWGRPAEAERCADAAERASYDGTLYDGSASIDSWHALMRAQHCRRGVARMRTDAELAVATLARGSRLRPSAMVLLAISHWLAGDIDQADDLFADVAEEGVALGAWAPVTFALGERGAIAIEREAWVHAEELADRALRYIRRSLMEEYPTSALAYSAAARVALHRGDAPRRRGAPDAGTASAAAAHLRAAAPRDPDPLGARTGLPGARRRRRRRHDAPRDRVDPAPTTRPRDAPGPGGRVARQPEDHAHPGPRRLDPDRGGAASCCPTSPRTSPSERSASVCTCPATP